MNARFLIIPACAILGGCGSIVHTPPRTSVEIALAKRAVVVRLAASAHPEPRQTRYRSAFVPPVEPELPINDRLEAVAETYTRGMESLAAGQTADAIKALEEATKLDPGFADAWQHLADAYEKAGQNAKAVEAYAKSKSAH